jgi:Sec-independent protein translocase protein TatA
MFIPWWLIVIIGIVLAVAIGSAGKKHKAPLSKLKAEIKELKEKLEEIQSDDDQE